MDARDQLLRLVRIQDLANAIREAEGVVEAAPARIAESENRFRERNSEYVAMKSRFDALEADRKARSFELETLEDARKKYMDSLMAVKNQREYAAALKEIDSVKAKIGDNEEAILKAMEEIDGLRGDLESRAAHIEEERKIVEQEHAQVDFDVAEARQRIASALQERARLEEELPVELVGQLRRIEESRRGVFMARVEKELCHACHVRVRPQVYQEIKQATRIHTCGNCRRVLYHEPSLDAASAEPPPAPSPGAGVEAMDGGAV